MVTCCCSFSPSSPPKHPLLLLLLRQTGCYQSPRIRHRHQKLRDRRRLQNYCEL